MSLRDLSQGREDALKKGQGFLPLAQAVRHGCCFHNPQGRAEK